LSHKQAVEKLNKKSEQINDLRLEMLNLKRNYLCQHNKTSLYKKMLILISQKDIPRLNTLLSDCLSMGNGINAILEKVKLAIEGAYKVKSYSDRERDMGVLVYRIGGPRLLYTFNQLNLLPSSSTIKRMLSSNYRLEYSFSKSIEERIKANLAQHLDKTPHIISLKMDELIIVPRFVHIYYIN
jgi:hypothetical protein